MAPGLSPEGQLALQGFARQGWYDNLKTRFQSSTIECTHENAVSLHIVCCASNNRINSKILHSRYYHQAWLNRRTNACSCFKGTMPIPQTTFPQKWDLTLLGRFFRPLVNLNIGVWPTVDASCGLQADRAVRPVGHGKPNRHLLWPNPNI
jgi:hypothetical protein